MAVNIRRSVVDASFVLSFLLPDESTKEVTEVFLQFEQGKTELISTKLLPFEVLNSLKSAILGKRVTQETAEALIRVFLRYQIPLLDVDLKSTLKQSIENNLSVYDACYLQLARANNLSLLTLDKHLRKFI